MRGADLSAKGRWAVSQFECNSPWRGVSRGPLRSHMLTGKQGTERKAMVGRIRRELPLVCACGARGYMTLEEDDIHERMEGGANPKTVAARGQVRLENDVLRCTECGDRYP